MGISPLGPRFPKGQGFGENPTRDLPPDHWLIRTFGNYQPFGHSGNDYPCPTGTPVYATEDGVCTWAGAGMNLPGDNSHAGYVSRYYLEKSGAGNVVALQHAARGGYVTLSYHLDRIAPGIVPGKVVKRGELIAYAGSTGRSTGPHLHFDVIPTTFAWGNGLYGRVNPDPYLADPWPGSTVTPQKSATLNGLDVSSWQTGIDLGAVPSSFVIVKLTGGTHYVNPAAAAQIASARKAGRLVGLYHYAAEDGRKGSPAAEADHFLRHATKYLDDSTVMVLDWENPAVIGAGGNVWARDWLNHVRNVTGRVPWLYGYTSALAAHQWATVSKLYPLWIAWYGHNNPFNGYASDFSLPFSVPAGFRLAAWQYSQHGRLPGWAPRDLDLNVFFGTAADWRRLAGKLGTSSGGGTTTSPAPAPVPTPPKPAERDLVHVARSGESVSSIARHYGRSVAQIVAANQYITNPNYLAVGDRVRIPKAGTPAVHVVKAGEYLKGIADRYMVTTARLLELNRYITNPNYLAVGDRVRVH